MHDRVAKTEEVPQLTRSNRPTNKVLAIFSKVLHPLRTYNQLEDKVGALLQPILPAENYNRAMQCFRRRNLTSWGIGAIGLVLLPFALLHFESGVLMLNANELHLGIAAPLMSLTAYMALAIPRRIMLDGWTLLMGKELRELTAIEKLLENNPKTLKLYKIFGIWGIILVFLATFGNFLSMTALVAHGAKIHYVMASKLLLAVAYVNIFYQTRLSGIEFLLSLVR